MISAVIYDILSNASTVTNIVSDRIYPMSAPLKKTYPLVNFTAVSKTPNNTKDGGSVVDISRVQIDTYSKDHTQSGAIDAAIRTVLDGYQADNQGHRIDRIYFERQSESYDPEQEIYRISTDYFIREKL